MTELGLGWLGRFRRLGRDDERLATLLKGRHLAALAAVMLAKLAS